eukprot:TRINITY_DN30491_c0_g1_i1.p1 TRINITY_DN30491_c0_g1~~TRINITY_DN30491_c0_g1_i1.p1  ORF type:complete len:640 (-),score=150.47 TRINITY_DN30491_c0_g1_i1:179-2041(-)
MRTPAQLCRTFDHEASSRLALLQAALGSELQQLTSRHLESFARQLAEVNELLLGEVEGTVDKGIPLACEDPNRKCSTAAELRESDWRNSHSQKQGLGTPDKTDADADADLSVFTLSCTFEGVPHEKRNGNDVVARDDQSDAEEDNAERCEVAVDKPEALEESTAKQEDFDRQVSDASASSDLAALKRKRSSAMSMSMEMKRKNSVVARIVTSKATEIFFSMAIILNCVTMGIEADGLVREHPEPLRLFMEVCEQVFVVLFSAELLARLWVYGPRSFMPTSSNGIMNFIDALLVLLTGVVMSLVSIIMAVMQTSTAGTGLLKTLSVFRAVRLLRIVRVIQKMPMFREVWLLLKGLTDSLRTLFWTVVVIFVITYIFAIFGLWIISNEIQKIGELSSDPLVKAEVEDVLLLIDGLPALMQLLIQFLTLDSWNSKMERIMVFAPWCVYYFYLYIAIAVFVLMNLVTAIIVENAMSASKMDEEQRLKQMDERKKKELKELEHLFTLMDTDGDGTLDWDEFEAAFADEEMSRKWRLLDFHAEECKELFELLDDGDGGIETSEFFGGLAKMKGDAQSRDLMRVNKNIERLSREIQIIGTTLATSPSIASQPDIRHEVGHRLPVAEP